MFKKSGSCQSKSEKLLRGKELKALRAGVAERFGLDDDALDLILPTKKGREVAQRRLGGGVRTELLCLDGTPVFIDAGSKGKSVNVCPTLSALWLVPRALPVMQIHAPVSKFVIGGSDLMMPGLHSVLPPPGAGANFKLSEGSYVAIAVAGNPLPLAVGMLLFDPLASGAGKGRVVETLHYYGDALWEASGKVRPNEGFLDQFVAPVGPVEYPEGQELADDDDEEEDEGSDHAEAETGVDAEAEAEAEAARLERLAAMDSDDELDALVQEEVENAELRDDFDDLDALVEAELASAAAGSTEAEPEPEPEVETAWPRTPEEMDEHLEICFLQAARTTLKSQKQKPIDAALLYSGHMRKVRKAGTDLDVKKSTHKKLVTFLKALSTKGIVDIKEEKKSGDIKVVIITSSRILRAYEPYGGSETAEAEAVAEETAGEVSAKATLSVAVVYGVTTDTRLLFAAVGAKEQEQLVKQRAASVHEHECEAAETGNGWRCDVCLKGCTELGQRYACPEGCDYDTCEACRALQQPAEHTKAATTQGEAEAGSFAALQAEQQDEADKNAPARATYGYSHLADVETRPYYTEVECHAFLQMYQKIFTVGASAQNRKILELDGLLTQVLYGSGGGGSDPFAVDVVKSVHQKKALETLLKRMKLGHKIDGLAAKKGVGERSSVRNGSPPPLFVSTATVKNHNVTLIRGLEGYGIDAKALANLLKRKLGANTTVGEYKIKSGADKADVSVSGLWEKSVAELLTAECGVDKRFVEVRAKKALAEKSKAKKKK